MAAGDAAVAFAAAVFKVDLPPMESRSVTVHIAPGAEAAEEPAALDADPSRALDAAFVGELGGRGPDGTIVAAVVELGHALGMTVTAEGVETTEQLVELESLGCDAAQGFALSRPISAEQLEELIMGAVGG